MDGKGRATDNSCIERFWRSAKCERIYLNEYQSISELIMAEVTNAKAAVLHYPKTSDNFLKFLI
jgi:hypothetical protein